MRAARHPALLTSWPALWPGGQASQRSALWCAWQRTTPGGDVFVCCRRIPPEKGSEALGKAAQPGLQILPAQDLGTATAVLLANTSAPHPLGCVPGWAHERMVAARVRKGRCAGQGPTPPVSNTGRVWGLLRQRADSAGSPHSTSEVGKG